jgi:hypothetical protein
LTYNENYITLRREKAMRLADYLNSIFEDDDVDVEFEKILSCIAKDTKITDLCLRGNWLTPKQLEHLAETLTAHSKLSNLNLSANEKIISDRGVASLKKIITEHSSLKSIQLDLNKISDADIKSLVENNSEELSKRILSIDFWFSSNSLTEESLKIADGKLSPSTILTMLFDNSMDTTVVERYRLKKLNELEAAKNPHEPSASHNTSPIASQIASPSPSFTPHLESKMQITHTISTDTVGKRKAEELLQDPTYSNFLELSAPEAKIFFTVLQDAYKDAFRKKQKVVPQQNLWVNGGSTNPPS